MGMTFAHEYDHRKCMKNPLLTLKQIISLKVKVVEKTSNNLICESFDCIILIKLIILQIQKSEILALIGCPSFFIQRPQNRSQILIY